MLAWGPITESDLGALGGLARACLREDGGLPTLAEESMLTELFLSGPAIGGRDETGDLVAVAAVCHRPGPPVDPAPRLRRTARRVVP